MHPYHERSLRRDIEETTCELNLIFLRPHLGRMIVSARNCIGVKLSDHHGLTELIVQRVQFARQRLSSLFEPSRLGVPSVVAIDADHIKNAVPAAPA